MATLSAKSQIKQLCRAYDIVPQHHRGQNFLANNQVIKRIVTAAKLEETDTVLEVGPGLGILTEGLVTSAGRVLSVELDKKLFDFLQLKFSSAQNLELYQQDILKFEPQDHNIDQYKIVANLPYNITSYFLRRFLTHEPKPSLMVLLVQREVAARICEGQGKLSLLAISVQLYGQPKVVGFVGRDNFWPEPEVDSAILLIDNIKGWSAITKPSVTLSEKQLWQLIKIGFSAKRKQLLNNLASGLRLSKPEAKEALARVKIDPQARAQSLSIADWFELAKNLENKLN